MFVNWKNNIVSLFNDNGSIIRKISVRDNVVDALIQGNGMAATISISLKNGHTELYKATGQLIRRI